MKTYQPPERPHRDPTKLAEYLNKRVNGKAPGGFRRIYYKEVELPGKMKAFTLVVINDDHDLLDISGMVGDLLQQEGRSASSWAGEFVLTDRQQEGPDIVRQLQSVLKEHGGLIWDLKAEEFPV